MKKLVAMLLVLLTVAAFTGTASAKALGDVVMMQSQYHATANGLFK